MTESGDKLNAAYRAPAREEPRAAIDDAILAASRRAVARPSGARRWAAPVSIAAVLVLAFGVTLHMQEESPGIESPDVSRVPPTPAAKPAAPAESFTPAPERAQNEAPPADRALRAPASPPKKKLSAEAKPDRGRAMEERDRGFRDEIRAEPERKDLATQSAPAVSEPALQKESKVMQAPMRQDASSEVRGVAPATVATPPPPAPAARASAAPAPAAPPQDGAMRLKREAAAAQAPAGFAADAQADEFTRDLEAIAKLRAEGRHDVAAK